MALEKCGTSVVLDRAKGKCENCGQKLTFDLAAGNSDDLATIQHSNGNSNELDDLQAYCRRCNLLDAQSRFTLVDFGSAEFDLAENLQNRWTSPTPLKICDDEEKWNDIWREVAKEAKEDLRNIAEALEGASDEDLPGFVGWTRNGTPIQDW